MNQPRVYLVQYIISLVLMATGYSAGNAMCYSIFSKIMGHFPQVRTGEEDAEPIITD